MTPGTARAMAGVDAADLPEYYRRDSALAINIPSAQLASDEWPQALQPSLEERQYIQFFTFSPDTFVFFFPDRRRR